MAGTRDLSPATGGTYTADYNQTYYVRVVQGGNITAVRTGLYDFVEYLNFATATPNTVYNVAGTYTGSVDGTYLINVTATGPGNTSGWDRKRLPRLAVLSPWQ